MYKKHHSSFLTLLELPEALLSCFQGMLKAFSESVASGNGACKEMRVIYKEKCLCIQELLHNNYTSQKIRSNEHFLARSSEIDAFIEKFDEVEIRQQSPERFTVLANDKFSIRIRKGFKRGVLRVHWRMLILLNFFRRLLRKSPLPLAYWKHRIVLKNIAELVYWIGFLKVTKPVLEQVMDGNKEIFLALKKLDEQIERKLLTGQQLPLDELNQSLIAIEEQLGRQKERINDHFKGIQNRLTPVFNGIAEKYGTLEFPEKMAGKKNLLRKQEELNRHIQHELRGQYVQSFAVFEHWRLKYSLRFALLNTSVQIEENIQGIESKIGEVLIQNYSRIEDRLAKASLELQSGRNTDDVVKSILQTELLENQIPHFLNLVLETDLASCYDAILTYCTTEWEELPHIYFLPKKPDFEKIRFPNQLRETNITDILRGNLEENISLSLSGEKSEMMRELQNALANSNEVGEIIDYSVEYYQTRELGEDSSTYDEFVNGIERARKKAEENLSFLKSLKANSIAKLAEINYGFNEKMLSAITLENLFDTQTEMLRRKRIKEVKNSVINFFKILSSRGEKGIHFFQNAFQFTRDKYSFLRSLLGLSTESEAIASELSNYLSETEIAISRLPLMYQKLFATVPLTEEKFSIGRPQVIHQLGLAYSNWTSGKFSPTCLIGETGSGSTTTLNFFIDKYGHQYSLSRHSISARITGEAEFSKYFKSLFPELDFESPLELITQINQGRSRRIIILENIEKFFIRKRGGFDNLHLLFRLISETSNRIFWLCSCKIYAWQYLNYTQDIANYFAYVIKLDTMDKDKITDVIVKRHKPSGFKLNFLPPSNFKAKRNFLKLSEKEKQNFLKEDFFNRLFAFAQNNLTLALIFWMRSVVKVEDNIFFLQFKHLNYSFLTAMNTTQITSLHAMLIHDCITVQELAEIFSWTEQESFEHLMVFKDDGILNKKNGQFTINPLLYRQLVEHLKSLNFVH
ncbi:MAG: hypothetical protein ACEPOZ_21350 [Marinifilaceae bacterium]